MKLPAEPLSVDKGAAFIRALDDLHYAASCVSRYAVAARVAWICDDRKIMANGYLESLGNHLAEITRLHAELSVVLTPASVQDTATAKQGEAA